MEKLQKTVEKLLTSRSLSVDEYEFLIKNRNSEIQKLLAEKAVELCREHYGNNVFVRGLIEISNICKNDCFYCGIRKSNKNCERYRLQKRDIIDCCKEGYALNFRTFVLQGGEDGFFNDEVLCDIIKSIKHLFPECAVTLSLGERERESYKKLKLAGADRYLLRHETADSEHYRALHPSDMTLDTRLKALNDLKELGYQVGCGFMVGSPLQTEKNIAKDLKFIEDFKPDMCGIGPFIPHSDTPFREFSSGDKELTLFLLSVIRIIHPKILLPATTALATVSDDGRQKGILSGANVVMPNLSPIGVRKKYMLYNNKVSTGEESAQSLKILEQKLKSIGYKIDYNRGDVKR